LAALFGEKNSISAIRSRAKDDAGWISEVGKSGQIQGGQWDVVWICQRELLPLFGANSLRALEIMVRKYAPVKKNGG
jgi:hypothetical protein